MLEQIDLSRKLPKDRYKREMQNLERRIGELQREARALGFPVLIVFEGWDAAGKGTMINRLLLALDPRGFKVHPTNPPNDEERHRPFLWRFWVRTPARGQIAIFDRTWYGRVLVERAEGFCSEAEWRRAYSEINEMEEQLANFGAVVVKFWLHISFDEQLRRFREREKISFKRWKITDEDWRNREKWPQYKQAVDEMLLRTSTTHAPWTIVEANCKRYACVKVL